jgi:N-acetylneuraminic acid mutarotase
VDAAQVYLPAERPATAREVQPTPERPEPRRAKKQQRHLPWLVVLLALALAAAGLIAYFMFLRDNTDSDQTTGTAPTATTTAGSSVPPAAGAAGAWTELDPAGAVPTARGGHVLVYDPKTSKAIMFGGAHLGTWLGDTWAFDLASGTWQEIDPGEAAPSARRYSQMVWDDVGGKMLLFGGEDASGSRNDIWSFDPTAAAWAELVPAAESPVPRFGHAMAQDPDSRRLIMFGGVNGTTRELLNDLWAYDPVTNVWAELEPLGALPTTRMWHSFVYEPKSRRFFLFGGYGGDSGTTGANLDDLWAYDLAANRWIALDPVGDAPLARQGHTMVLDQVSGDLLLYGGCDGLTGLSDAWSYDQTADSWTRLQPPGDVPAGRDSHAMTYDSVNRAMILFGGYDFAFNIDFNDTWTYGANPSGEDL